MSLAKRLLNNPALVALCTQSELSEVLAIGNAPKHISIKLVYRGQMKWAKQYGIDARLWDVVSPVLPHYDYSSGGYPTFTVEGLKKEKLI